MSTLQDLKQVLSRKQEILDENSAGVEKQKKSGKLTARERVNLLLDDGKVKDVSAGEEFGTTPHPRTVVGLTEDGRVVILVIDGRRPWHSNGATLYECAILLKEHGAVRGVNLDGGGSSTFIVKNTDGEPEMLNQPADLHRPYENLIRDVFDCILIVKK